MNELEERPPPVRPVWSPVKPAQTVSLTSGGGGDRRAILSLSSDAYAMIATACLDQKPAPMAGMVPPQGGGEGKCSSR